MAEVAVLRLKVDGSNLITGFGQVDTAVRKNDGTMKAYGETLSAVQKQYRQTAAVSSWIKSLADENRQMIQTIAATKAGAAAVAALNRSREIAAALSRAGVTAESAIGRALAATITKQQQLKAELKSVEAAQRAAATSATQLATAQQRSATSAKSAGTSLLGMATAIKAIVAGSAARELLQAAVSMDRLNSRMLQAAGTSAAATKEWGFVRGEAKRLGLDLEQAAFAYTGFATSAKLSGISAADTRAVFVAVSEAATVMGLSGMEAAGALRALQQMASKGTVSAEELRQQLGEHLPGAFSLAAKAMGMTEAALGKAMAEGQVMASELLPKLAAVMHETFGAKATAAANNAQAQLNRVKTVAFDLTVAFANSLKPGVLDLAKALSEVGSNDSANQMLRDLGTEASNTISKLADLVKILGTVTAFLADLGRGSSSKDGYVKDAPISAGWMGDVKWIEIASTQVRVINDIWDALSKVKDLTSSEKWSVAGDATLPGSLHESALEKQLKAIKANDAARGEATKHLLEESTALGKQVAKLNAADAELKRIREAYEKYTGTMQRNAVQAREMAAAHRSGAAAAAEMERAHAIANKIFEAGTKLSETQALQVAAMAAEEYGAAAAVKEHAEGQANLKSWLERVRAEVERITELGRERMTQLGHEIIAATAIANGLEFEVHLERQRIAALKEGREAWLDYAEARARAETIRANPKALPDDVDRIGQATRALEALKATEWGKSLEEANKNALAGIQSAFSGFFKKLLTEGKLTWKELGKGLIDVFASVVSELLARWIVLELEKTATTIREAATRAAAERASQAAGSGGGTGMFGNVVGGVSSTAPAVSGGGGGMAAGAGAMGAVLLIFAAVYVGVSAWIKKNKAKFNYGEIAVTMHEGQLVANNIKGASGQIERLLDMLSEMTKALHGTFNAIGATVTGMEGQLNIGTKGQGKNRRYWVTYAEGLVRNFGDDAQAAFEFAVVQAIKQAKTTGLSPIVAAAIKGSAAETIEAMQADIADAFKVANLGQPEFVGSLRAELMELDRLRAAMVRLIPDTALLADALGNINRAEAELFASERDRITGRKKSRAEELADQKREADLWNAERLLRIANINLMALETKAKIQMMLATAHMVNGLLRWSGDLLNGGEGGGIGRGGRPVPGGPYKGGTGEAPFVPPRPGEGTGNAQLDGLYQFLDALMAILAGLPGAIDPSELGRIGRGGDRQAARDSAADAAKEIGIRYAQRGMGETAVALDDINRKWAEHAKAAKGNAKLLAEVNTARAQEIELLQIATREKYADYLGPQGRTDQGKGIDAFLGELNAIPRDVLPNWMKAIIKTRFLAEQLLATTDRLHAFGGDFFPTSEIDRIRADASGIAADFQKIFAEGGMGAEDLAAKLRLVADAEKYRLEQIETGIGRDLFGYLKDVPAFAGQAAEFAKMELTAKFEGYRIQLLALGVWEKWAGVFNAALAAGMAAIEGMVNLVSDATPENNARILREREVERLEDLAKGRKALLDRLAGYGELQFDPITRGLRALNQEFAEMRAEATRLQVPLSKVNAAYTLALNDWWKNTLQGVRDFRDSMATAATSSLTGEQQFAASRGSFRESLASLRGGDLSQISRITGLGQQYMTFGQQSTGGEAYRFIEKEVRDAMTQILGFAAPTSASPTGALTSPMYMEAPSVVTAIGGVAATVQNAAIVHVAAIREMKAELSAALSKIEANTEVTAQHAISMRNVA